MLTSAKREGRRKRTWKGRKNKKNNAAAAVVDEVAFVLLLLLLRNGRRAEMSRMKGDSEVANECPAVVVSEALPDQMCPLVCTGCSTHFNYPGLIRPDLRRQVRTQQSLSLLVLVLPPPQFFFFFFPVRPPYILAVIYNRSHDVGGGGSCRCCWGSSRTNSAYPVLVTLFALERFPGWPRNLSWTLHDSTYGVSGPQKYSLVVVMRVLSPFVEYLRNVCEYYSIWLTRAFSLSQ